MMRLLTLLVRALSFASCGVLKRHKDHDTEQSLVDVQRERDARVERFDVSTIERCDRITFLALFDAFGKRQDNLFDYEKQPGRWERDIASCYPKDSQSTISRDGLISVMHALHARGNEGALKRIHDYGEEHGWDMGEGPWDLVNAAPLVPVIHKLSGKPLLRQTQESRDGFLPHIVGLYIWLAAKAWGGIDDAQLLALRELRDRNQDNPYFHALYHRFTDGDQTAALERMGNIGTEDAPFGWGSAPADVVFAITVGVMEGR